MWCTRVCRVQRASTGLPSSREQAEKTERPWHSAPVTDGRTAGSEASDSCVSVVESAAAAAAVESETTTVVRRRLVDETMLDLTTPTTTQCHNLHEYVTTPGTPRPSPSRRTSDTLADAGSRPGSSRHAVLPPIRQLRSVDTVVTVGSPVAVGDISDS